MTQEAGQWQRRVFQVVMPIEAITLAVLLVSSPVGVPIGAAIVYVVLVGAALALGLFGSIVGCFAKPRPPWAIPALLLHTALLGTVTLWRPVVGMIDGIEEGREYRKVVDTKQQKRLRAELTRLVRTDQLASARKFLRQHDELRVGYGPALQAVLCGAGAGPDPELFKLLQRRSAPAGGDLLLEAAQCPLPAFLAVARALEIPPVSLARNGRSPITKATDLELLRYLLKQGVDVNARDKQGATPLMYHRNREVTRFLLAHGADAKAQDHAGRSALHYRAPDGEAAAIYTLLLDAGADVNLQDADKKTPLLRMERVGSDSPWVQAAADVLVARGARSEDRVSVVWALLEHRENAHQRTIPLEPCLKWDDLDLAGKGGATLLVVAIRKRQWEVMNRLLELGANPTAITENGETALGSYEESYHPTEPYSETYLALREAAARFSADSGVQPPDAGS